MITQDRDELYAATLRLQMELDAVFASDEHLGPRDRKRLTLALQSIVAFMGHAGVRASQQHALSDLVDGLNELDRGTVRPFLQPTGGFSNRHLDGADVWRARGAVSGAFYALSLANKSRKQASAIIGRFKHLEKLPGKQAKSLRTAAESWFDLFRKGEISDPSAVEAFQQISVAADKLAEQHPEKLEAFAIKILSDQSGVFSFSKPST